MKAPAVRPLLAADAGAAGGMEVTFPAWINGNPLSQVEKLAMDAVNHELVLDEPVHLPCASCRTIARSKCAIWRSTA